MQAKHQIEKLNICKWWLDRGFYLLPAQVGKKYLLRGWGEHQQKITDERQAHSMFDTRGGQINAAVLVVRDDQLILDFDSVELYSSWSIKHPEIAQTYTERTPRGGAHVFVKCVVPVGLVLVPGVEIKRVCLVHPSTVNGQQYTQGEGEILEADQDRVFSSLSKPGTKTARLLTVQKTSTVPHPSKDLIEKIKTHWHTEKVFELYRPEINFKPSGAVLVACCAFHKDTRPSMWVNPATGFWKCHACGKYGDVINAYALLQNISIQDAIRRMAASLAVSS